MIRIDGGIFFATADAIEDRVRAAILDEVTTGLVLHFAGVNFVDSQGSAKLSEIVRLADESGVGLRVAAVRPAVRQLLERDGVIDLIGAERILDTVSAAVASAQAARGNAPEQSDPAPP